MQVTHALNMSDVQTMGLKEHGPPHQATVWTTQRAEESQGITVGVNHHRATSRTNIHLKVL